MGADCPVRGNCRTPDHCPFCVEGSEYRPIDKRVIFPAAAERACKWAETKRAHRSSEAYRSGKRSNQKGKRREREVAKLLGGERVPLSGALDGHPNDVVLPNGWRSEVKARQSGLAFLYTWLESADVVAFREPGEPWLFAIGMPRFRLWLGSAGVRRQALAGAIAALRRGQTEAMVAKGVRLVAHERRSGFTTIRRWLAAENADALLFKADRMEWLAVMDERHLFDLLTETRINGEVKQAGVGRR